MKDFYNILGVSKTASQDEIKKSYRKVAMKYHPDRNPDNEEAENKFKEAAEAYAVLSDANKRTQYDQFGHAGIRNSSHGGGFQGGINVEDIFSSVFGGGGGFSDIFGGDVFGNQSGRSRKRKSENLTVTISLTLEEIFKGTTKKIKFKRWEKSSTSSAVKCNTCNGSGEIRHVQNSMLGQIVNVQVCSSCNGIGYSGGREQKIAIVPVKIPAGVTSMHVMREAGQGNHSIVGDENGDLIINFEEKKHDLFSRADNHVYLECVINYCDAVLGTKIEVPTLDGKVKFNIPKGIKNGKILRLKNRGFNEVNRMKKGDQYIKITIDIPSNISKELKQSILSLKNNLNDEAKFKKIDN